MANDQQGSLDRAMTEARDRLSTALEGKGAHLSFESAVRDLPDALMNEKTPYVPYTLWHQLEHIRRTQLDMLNYIRDPAYVSPEWPREYWPAKDENTDRAGWKDTIDRYLADRRTFVELIRNPETDLFAPVAHMENRSIMRAAIIIIDHTAYHLGEFVMARQMLGAWKSELA